MPAYNAFRGVPCYGNNALLDTILRKKSNFQRDIVSDSGAIPDFYREGAHQVVITLLTIPAFLTGEVAEETVEHLQDVSEPYIEAHEDLAGVAFWLMIGTGGMALFTFFVSTMRNNRNIILKMITVLLAVGTFVIMIMVENYGGRIRHSELSKQSVIQNSNEFRRLYGHCLLLN
ncbi:hypothetical protein [Sinomicrobium sp. M5D2P17]